MLVVTDFPEYSDRTTPEIGDLVFSKKENITGKLVDITKGISYQEWYGHVAAVTTIEITSDLSTYLKSSQINYSSKTKKYFAAKIDTHSCDIRNLKKLG